MSRSGKSRLSALTLPLPFLGLLTASFVIIENKPFKATYVDEPDDLRRAEFYPLSSFPMYADFSDAPNYVFVTRPDGSPVAALNELGVLTSVLKKAYDKELRKIKAETGVPMRDMSAADKRPAGDKILRRLQEEISPAKFADGSFPALQLHEGVIRRGTDPETGKPGIQTQTTLVGDVRF